MTAAPRAPLAGNDRPVTVVLTAGSTAEESSAGTALGGKGSSLADLARARFPIPPTGVITAEAYRRVATDPDIAALVVRLGTGEPVADVDVDELFARVPVPPELERSVVELAATVGEGRPIAVRSSATVEDLAGSSFAGQYRSFLNVDSSDPAAVMAAVRHVWASLWHPAPVAYRRAFGIDPDGVAMAVVVMAMVPATTAGVVFTIDPGGSHGARIEAVEGLGEALVSGSRTPSAWVVPRDPAAWGDLPPAAAGALELALEVEAHTGVAQDVEWAAVGDVVQLVQARPITVLGNDDGFDTALDDHELTTAGIAEMVPGVLPALRWELNRFILEEAFRSVLDSLGFHFSGAAHDAPLVRRVRGRVAIDYEQLRTAAAAVPGAVDDLEMQYFGAVPDAITSRRRRPSLTGLGRELRAIQTRSQVTEQAEVVVRAVTSLRSRTPELSKQSDDELLAYVRRLVDLAARGLAAELGVAAASGAAYQRLAQTLTRFLRGGPVDAELQAVIGAATTFTEPTPTASAAVFAGPTWVELGAVPPSIPPHAGTFTERRTRLEQRLASQPGWRRQRILTGQVIDVRIHLLRRTIAEVVETTRLREQAKGAVLELGGEVRRVVLELGRRLVERGSLDRADDIELVSYEELLAAIGGQQVVAPDVRRRRRNWITRFDNEGTLPLRFVGEPDRRPAPLPPGRTLTGWAASPGRVRAAARVVTKPSGRLEPGEILVADSTDASWSPLFVKASGVVVERGGPLSHAAILARELGLPAVLNLPGATRRLDGRTVTVDGDRGLVVIETSDDDISDDDISDDDISDDDIRNSSNDDVGSSSEGDDRDAGTPRHDERKLVPWPRGRTPEDPFEGVDTDRLMVFVPAVMSVGLVMSMVALIRDTLRWTRRHTRERRTAIEAAAVVSELLGEDDPLPRELGILSRPSYLMITIALVGTGAYVSIGSTANYLRDGGYVSDISWLLALSLGLTVLLGFLGGVSLAVYWRWPTPPAWTYGSLRGAPLTTVPGRSDDGTTWRLMAAVWVAAFATGIIALMVGSRSLIAEDIDGPIARWLAETDSLGRFAKADIFGSTWVSGAFAALVALSAFRCRVMAVLIPVSFVGTWVSAELLRNAIDRPRPLDPANLGSFPSGHMVQLVFVAGLVPVAMTVLGADRRLVVVVQTALGGTVAFSGLYRIHQQSHWPLDVLAGITVGLTAVFATRWVLAHHHWHQQCAQCPWSEHPVDRPWTRGLVRLDDRTQGRLGRIGVGLAVGAAIGLHLFFQVTGVPRDPEGYGFGSAVAEPVQRGLAGLLAAAGLLALRFRAPAALLMMLCATGLGLFASIQYPPRIAVALTIALLIPAILTWLAWQHHATMGSIAMLALITTSVVAGTATGTTTIYNHFFGPTHPSSRAEPLSSAARWLWLGAVGPRDATVVAGGLDAGARAVLHYESDDTGAAPQQEQAAVDQYGLARFELSGLEPATGYRYAVTVDDPIDVQSDTDEGTLREPDGRFTTFAVGPQDLVVVLGSCARSGSNGAVFDAMVAEQPDLYLALGDIHYGNLTSSDPADHVRQYGGSIGQPGQSVLARSVPTAYVWDDHDYGPNDADSTSPSRPGVGTAYRAAVPHYSVDPDPEASVAQAFTVGRVRFVLSDTRSQRNDDTMLGPQQEAWLIEELTTSARSHALVVWANPTPWISAEGTDNWGAYPAERQRISEALSAAGVDNLVMVSGDAHMVAIDDGTNSGYAVDGGPGFPVLHAAALDRPGNVKGGPYSEGVFPGPGQYGLLEVDDDGGDSIKVRLAGRTWDGRELTALDLTFDGLAS